MTTIHNSSGGFGVYNDHTDYTVEVIRNGCLCYLPAKLVEVGDLVTPYAFFTSQAEAEVYIAELLPVVKVEHR